MMRQTRFWLTLALALIGVACEGDSLLLPESDLVVVEAFLYAGQPVTNVKLTLTIPLDSDEAPEPLPDAQVTLTRDGVEFALISTEGEPGYYHYPGSDLEVVPGDEFALEVRHDGRIVTGETVVPTPPEGLSLSSDTMAIANLGLGMGGFGGKFSFSSLLVYWSNPDWSYYYVTADNLEADPAPMPHTEMFTRPIRFISQPVQSDSMGVNQFTLTHYGVHRLNLYHVNQEYADLYEGQTQDSRDLNEPPSNISGGLGVFSAFTADSAFFVAVEG
jgi:hypothetical protein